MDAYEAWLVRLREEGYAALIGEGIAHATPAEQALDGLQEVIMLSLRTSNGLDLEDIRLTYGVSVSSAIRKALEKYREGDLVISTSRRMRLADPEGFLLSNDIISSVFAALPNDF
jgi:coproporphyrinogen III oxidase-like Fe-S oxidoreductase